MKFMNIVIVGSILAILYLFIGHGFVLFYWDGKSNILALGNTINAQCHQAGACPTTLEGWYEVSTGQLRRGSMLYVYPMDNLSPAHTSPAGPQTFKIVYTMPMPDDWFEVEGGVGLPVTSGWKSRNSAELFR